MTLRAFEDTTTQTDCLTDDCPNIAPITPETVCYDDREFGVIAGYICWDCLRIERLMQEESAQYFTGH